MSHVVYSFEAKSIQNYVLATNKLKDQIGGSQQIESLCYQGGKLDQVLDKLALNDEILFARKSGGAFIAIFDTEKIQNAFQQAKDLQAVWTFTIQKLMPGLHFNQGIGEGNSTIEAVKSAFENQHQSQLHPDLPLANPFTIYSQRSGKAATHLKYFKKSDQYELLDTTTQLKRDLIDDVKKGKKPDLLIEKLNLEDSAIHWPSIMPEDKEDADKDDIFPFESEDHTIGILHADINNLGNTLLAFAKKLTNENYQRAAKDFSEEIEKAVNKAVKRAINNLNDKLEPNKNGKKNMPARPLVLAGDDITFILRGDIAMEFSQILLTELEKTTKEGITNLQKKHNDIPDLPALPAHMTACAGIAYIKASQPFYQGYKLSNSLCEWAKHQSKKRMKNNNLSIVPSSIAYHRITTSMIDDYPTIVRKELTTGNNLLLSYQPYFLARNNETPRLEHLLKLESALQEIGHGQLRPLLNLLHESESQANKAFKRWCTVMDKKGKKHQKLKQEIIKNLLKLVNKDYLTNKTDTEFTSFSEKKRDDTDNNLFYRYTPLADCISLTQIHPQKETSS